MHVEYIKDLYHGRMVTSLDACVCYGYGEKDEEESYIFGCMVLTHIGQCSLTHIVKCMESKTIKQTTIHKQWQDLMSKLTRSNNQHDRK